MATDAALRWAGGRGRSLLRAGPSRVSDPGDTKYTLSRFRSGATHGQQHPAHSCPLAKLMGPYRELSGRVAAGATPARIRIPPWLGRRTRLPDPPFAPARTLAIAHAGARRSNHLRGAVALPPKQARAYGASRLSLLVRSGCELRASGDARLSREQRRLGPRRTPRRCSDSSEGAVSRGSRRPPETAGFVVVDQRTSVTGAQATKVAVPGGRGAVRGWHDLTRGRDWG